MYVPAKPVTQMEVYAIAQRLRELMSCHDKASHQILLLDCRIRENVRRHRRLSPSPVFSQFRIRLEERISIYEWMREAYDEYRHVKWVTIQQVIFTMFNGYYVPQTINSIISIATHHLYSGTANDSMELDSDDDEDEEAMDVLPAMDGSFVSYQGDRFM
ncbi:uncharacterized protein LOC110465470 [Mizuhopecten yessoensis]|uniref:uncharacterized protein LOC110465470 n=1 Tax=Mizuhopecten yessoensis TaxID=6573 RepID=UPI000B45A984|nr:uncharacterized protein LOC110465470 [Mizuhopecten yessoensis]